MNVKFKMPNFKRKLTGKSMAREIFMTVVGTSISIVLTFGTAYIIESCQHRAAGRQAAMMVILDMEESIEQMQQMAKMEEKSYNVARYVMDHYEDLDSLPSDTVFTAFCYFMPENAINIDFDESKEKIFHSSQDSWKNINNAQFISQVQAFYHSRHNVKDFFKELNAFRSPVSLDEEYQLMLQAPGYDLREIAKEVLRERLTDKVFGLYLEYSPARQRQYLFYANLWNDMANNSKFLMGISDPELQKYVDEQEHTGSLMKKRDFIGSWISDTEEDHQDEITFNKDGTLVHTSTRRTISPQWTGQLVQTLTMTGTWTIEGDSLVRYYPKNQCHYELDTTQISYSPQQIEEAEMFINSFRNSVEMTNELNKADTSVVRRANAAYIDDSGYMVELSRQELDEYGDVKMVKSYMVRKAKK